WVSGENPLLGKARGEIFDDALRFAQIAMLGLQIRYFAKRRMFEKRLVLARLHEHLLERNAILEQHEFHLVVVVRQRKTAQLDHRVSPIFTLYQTVRSSRSSGFRANDPVNCTIVLF